MKNLIVGADPWGMDLKKVVLRHLQQKGYAVTDLNDGKQSDNYYDVAVRAAGQIQAQAADGAFLFCGTGMGMSIVCNKHQGIVASVVETPWAAKMARAVNNANVLCMGGMNVKPEAAIEAVDNFLGTNLGDGLAEYLPFLQEATKQVAGIDQANRQPIPGK
jgi:ribose 5-phosphate isomerase B